MLLSITAPQTNQRGPRYMEKALAAIHQANNNSDTIQLLYARGGDHTGFYVRVRNVFKQVVTDAIGAQKAWSATLRA